MSGAIDIVCSPVTPKDIRLGRVGVDERVLDQLRMPKKYRKGVPMPDYVRMMDEGGVDRSLLIAVRGGDLRKQYSFEVPYEDVHDTCRKWPDRFSGLAGIDPTRGMQGLRDLEYAVTQARFRRRAYLSALDRTAARRGAVLPLLRQVLRTRHPGDDAGRAQPDLPAGTAPCQRRPAHPARPHRHRLPRAQDHRHPYRHPWTDEMISMCWKHENVYMCGDAYAPRYWPPQFVHYANTYGQDKVLFGTDWPALTPRRCMDEIAGLGFRPGPLRKMLRDNALKVFTKLPEAKAAVSRATAAERGRRGR
jgi:predicted TIM-barrel fold metal-dependent hydrolase